MIQIPKGPKSILATLQSHGYEAYVVGGCVRDALLGLQPHDWDICTSARPEQVISCFQDTKVIETGISHGTVAIVLDHVVYEVTTYRIDGAYSDGRHPDSVQFVPDLKMDLARRDFTMNAMAADINGVVIDYYDGASDLSAKCIRCVGEADLRFQEDALRILRALRFAATYDFSLDPSTALSVHRNRTLLSCVAAERIQMEISRMLLGKGIGHILANYLDVLCVFLPELEPLAGFTQMNPHHHLDVWQHTVLATANGPDKLVVRLALLFHDIAKPNCFTVDEQGISHFYGHPQKGADMTSQILKRLRYDNDTINMVHELIYFHDAEIPSRRQAIRRWLNRIGVQQLRHLFAVARADKAAQAPELVESKLMQIDKAEQVLDQVLEEGACFSMKQLNINGRDLIELGVREGREVGRLLRMIMDAVIEERVENCHSALLEEAKRQINRLPS